MLDDMKPEKVDTVSFPCPQLGHLQVWHHVVVTMAKTLRQRSKVSLFMDGISLGVQKVYMHVHCRTDQNCGSVVCIYV